MTKFEIKKIMEENKLEEIFDVQEEACYNDCHNWHYGYDHETGTYRWKDYPTSKGTWQY